MAPKIAILMSVTLSLVIAPAVKAQSTPGAIYAAREQIIQAQKEAEAAKAKEDAAKSSESGSGSGDGTTTTGTTGGDSNTAADKKDDGDKKAEEKKDDGEKKADDKKTDEGDKKAEDKKSDDKKAEDKKAEDEKKAEADKKAEEEKKAAAEADKKLLEKKESYDPMKDAIFAMNVGKYADCINLLNQVLTKDKNNLQARYLLGVSYVMTRKYSEAAEQYRKVMQVAPNSPLGKLAADGLNKIAK